MTIELNQRDIICEALDREVNGKMVTYITVHSKNTWKNPQVSLGKWC
jgi:hypothetical protein